jgi:uncharacterized zinc-type alcohol dehydrogenase-like protein
MAIAILNAMGAEIVAFSSSPDKRAQALRMGAHDYVGSTDVREIRKLGGRLDLILSTVHARLDWVTYLQALRPNGVLCLLGGGTSLLQISQQALLGQRSITTGEIGSRAAIAEVLAFAARHAIAPEIEVAAMHDAQLQIDRLRKNQVRYRAVLENR